MSKTFNSFAALGAALGVKPEEAPQRPDTKKCFKCGGNMVRVANTNVYVCTGQIKNKKGELTDCPNSTLAKAV